MKAKQLKTGQFFTIVHHGELSRYSITDVLECVNENRPDHWLKYPGVVFRNTRTGLYGGLGGENEIKLKD